MTALDRFVLPETRFSAAILYVAAHSEILLDTAFHAEGKDSAMSSIIDTMISVYTAFPL